MNTESHTDKDANLFDLLAETYGYEHTANLYKLHGLQSGDLQADQLINSVDSTNF